MELMQAKKLFSPPDKIDGTKLHLINMVNKAFETLAMDLVSIAPKSEHLDEVIHDVNKARLLFNHSIEIMKTGKEKPVDPETLKEPKVRKPRPVKDQEQNENENDNGNDNEKIEGFE